MSGRAALPGLATGALGLVSGVLSLGLDNPAFGGVAGILALAAGLAGTRVSQRLGEQSQVQSLIEGELRSMRHESQEAEKQIKSLEADLEEAESDDYYEDEEVEDALTDPTTGLFSQSFFDVALDSRIAAAKRHLRPVAIILLEAVVGDAAKNPELAEPDLLSGAIKATIREADTACRLSNGHFALLLEDTPETGAVWTVERIRRNLNDAENSEGVTLWAGVACYPAHAFTSESVMQAANEALVQAKDWPQDRIEVALAAAE